jgi:hypothetical protein
MSSGSGHDDLSATEPSTRRERAGTERGRVARGKRKFRVPAVVKAMSAAGCVVICAEHDPHTSPASDKTSPTMLITWIVN